MNMHKIDVAGLKVDSTTKQELLDVIARRMKAGERTFVITPYSEFLYHSLITPGLLNIFNKADISVPDGIGIFWAAKFLQIPFTVKNYYLKIFQAAWQVLYSLYAILVYPRFIYSTFDVIPTDEYTRGVEESLNVTDGKGSLHSDAFSRDDTKKQNTHAEKISGSDLIWDLSELAAKNNWSIYLLGGYGNTPEIVANKLISKPANKLKIAGYSTKHPNDPSVIDDIKKAKPDMVFVAYGPIQQERWIVEHMGKLPAKFYIGLGGTFDYVAGVKKSPPRFIRRIGLEWLYRLITQPHRIKRIANATLGLITALVRHKVFSNCPLRQNAVAIILNKENKVLVCKRTSTPSVVRAYTLSQGKHEAYNVWEFLQGGVEPGESLEDTAIREALEETGLQGLEVFKVSSQKNIYKWTNANRHLWSVTNRNSGQEQGIVYLRYTGDNNSIQLEKGVLEKYNWISINEAEDLLHPYLKPIARIAKQELMDM